MDVTITGVDTYLIGFLAVFTAGLILYMRVSSSTDHVYTRFERRFGLTPIAVDAIIAVLFLGLCPILVLIPSITEIGDFVFAILYMTFVAGAVLVVTAVSNVDEYVLVMRTETSVAGMVGTGRVEVSGEAMSGDDVDQTPFTGTDAVCYTYLVSEKKRTKGSSKESWQPIHAGEGGVPFYVNDGTGEVLVDPVDAELRLRSRDQVQVAADDDLPDRINEYIKDTPDLGYAGDDRKYVEHRIEPGDEVYVLGDATGDTGAEYSSNPVIGANGDYCLITTGSVDDVKRRLKRTVVGGSLAGLLLMVVGYGGLFRMAGVV